LRKKIPVSSPAIGHRERSAAAKAVSAGHISGLAGPEIEKFESSFAEFNGSGFAVACSSGTAALHLALVALGLGPGDEVLVADTTNMASFFAVLYTGATPVPVDILPDSMTMDPADLRRKITPSSKAIMPVHLFGQPCDMGAIVQTAEEFGLHIVEDCAEAHGAQHNGRQVGSFGIAGCFSFFANKIVATGEGGMITTNDANFAEDLRALRSLNFGDGTNRFLHRGVGFNYRMTNVQAAIGIAQLKRVDWLTESRQRVEQIYRDRLAGLGSIVWAKPVDEFALPVTWMAHIALPSNFERDRLIVGLAERGIESRPGFIPFTMQKESWARSSTGAFVNPIARDLASRTMYLPTWSGMPERVSRKVASSVALLLDR
jgi:perosamine synthetase